MRHLPTRRALAPMAPLGSIGLASLVAAMSGPAARADDPASPVAVDDLLRRVEQLESRNRSLAGEVAALREADGQGWLTEQRAAEIRELVEDTLADAGTRASLQSAGMTAGWDDGFFLQSPDGRFRLELGGMIQFRWVYNWIRTPSPATGTTALQAFWSDGRETRYGFEMPGTELWFKGHIFGPGLTYKIKGVFTNSDSVYLSPGNVRPQETGGGIFELHDAWARWELGANWFFRAGQFKLPFAREELVDRQYQLAVDPSVVSESLGVGYSQGIELAYVSDLFRGAVAFSDGGTDSVAGQLKVAGSLPQNRPYWRGQSEWAVTGRLEFKPFGEWRDFESFTSPPGSDFGLMFGLAAHWQSWRPDYQYQIPGLNQGDNRWLMMTADASANFGGASLYGAFSYSYADSESAYAYAGPNNFNVPTYGDMGSSNKWGMVVQGGLYVAPKIELFARYELGQFTVSNPGAVPIPGGIGSLYAFENHLHLISAGVNWYIDGHDVKLTSDIGYAIDSFGPSWFSGDNGWRVTGTRDEFVFRTQLQLVF